MCLVTIKEAISYNECQIGSLIQMLEDGGLS